MSDTKTPAWFASYAAAMRLIEDIHGKLSDLPADDKRRLQRALDFIDQAHLLLVAYGAAKGAKIEVPK